MQLAKAVGSWQLAVCGLQLLQLHVAFIEGNFFYIDLLTITC